MSGSNDESEHSGSACANPSAPKRQKLATAIPVPELAQREFKDGGDSIKVKQIPINVQLPSRLRPCTASLILSQSLVAVQFRSPAGRRGRCVRVGGVRIGEQASRRQDHWKW